MPNTIKVNINGVDHEAVEISFEIVKEDWNEYKLLDGGRVRTKTVVQRIFKVTEADGSQTKTPAGEPLYIVRHNTQVVPS